MYSNQEWLQTAEFVTVGQYETASTAWRARWLAPTSELVVGDTDGNLTIFGSRGQTSFVPIGVREYITDIETCEENEFLVATLRQGVYRYHRRSGQVSRMRIPIQSVLDVAIFASRRLIAAVGDGIVIGNLPQGDFTQVIERPVPNPSAVAFSPDASLMVVGGGEDATEQAQLAVLDINRRRVAQKVYLGADALCISRLAFSECGRFVASGGYKECFVLDTDDSYHVKAVIPMTGWISALRFSEASNSLLIGDDNGVISVYDVISGDYYYLSVAGTILDFGFGCHAHGQLYVIYAEGKSVSDKEGSLVKVVRFSHLR